MLVEHYDISVQGGEYRMHDCVITRLELRSLNQGASLESAVFALVTFGDFSPTTPVIQVHTAGFQLSEIPAYRDYFGRWRKLNGVHLFEGGFLDYLPQALPVSIELTVENGRMERLTVQIGNHVKLSGRFPQDVDALKLYFGVVDKVLD